MLGNLLATLIGLLSLLGLAPVNDAAPIGAPRPPELTVPGESAVDAAAANAPLPTVGIVSIRRYAGTWHELARLPVRFQDPESVSIAQYEVLPDNSGLSVQNTSYIGDEVGYSIRGTATPADPERTDRLRVSFGGLLAVVPVSDEGNYWIVELASDYSMALVGTPDRRSLWLLARDATGYDVDRANDFLMRAAELGFDTSKVTLADWKTRRMGD